MILLKKKKILWIRHKYFFHFVFRKDVNVVEIENQIEELTGVIHECDNAKIAATDMLNLRIQKDIDELSEKSESLKKLIQQHQDQWSNDYIQQFKITESDINRQLSEKQHLLAQDTSKASIKFGKSVKRIASTLIEENRVKRRKVGSGAPRKMDSEDEEHLLNIIEGQGSDPHGRRRDEVSYIRKRYTKQKLQRMVNEHRAHSGKSTIKSSSTVYNRMKPVNKRHIQAKKHIGKGLFCVRKPPKSESNDRIHTKYQRAHIKRTITHLIDSSKFPKMCLVVSTDDKAYVKAEGSDALDKKSFQSCNESNAGKLPKYDFANAQLHITPGSHRFIDYKTNHVDGKIVLETVEDESVCVMRPKYYVGSSGSVWASEEFRLRCEKPYLYEEPDDRNHHFGFTGGCAQVQMKLCHYLDSLEYEDIARITNNMDCKFAEYERLRLNNLSICIKKGQLMLQTSFELMSEDEKSRCVVLQSTIDEVQLKISEIMQMFNHVNIIDPCDKINVLKDVCNRAMETLSQFNLPPLRPWVFEQTDAGLGVGVSNKQIRMRAAERIRI